MNKQYLSRGKRVDYNDTWIIGHYGGLNDYTRKHFMLCNAMRDMYTIDPSTLGRCTGLHDRNEKLIFEGDITQLFLPDGGTRRFLVASKRLYARSSPIIHPGVA